VSYLVEVDGQRIIFSGDVIHSEGRVWDIYSLQKGFAKGGQQVGDYHGFLGARPELMRSLGRLKQAGATTIIPSHGSFMTDPPKAIDTLVQRLDACYDQYVAISALRHYYPKLFTEFAGRKDHMPFAPAKPVPSCLRHYGTSWVLVSQDKAAFVMDCGGSHVVQAMKKLVDKGEIRTVEGLWVTHYHDDHVDAIPEFLDAFKCPCITDRSVAEVITDPPAWRLPCISPNKARVDRATTDGESWQWHEFRMTAYHLPGQTLYHSGLLVEGQGMRMFFVGDSFTPAGIDDYCAQNRCWLGRGVGFDRCISLIEELKPTHLFNCHVDQAWEFSPEQCRFMRENLARREELFGRLVPWDHANYGMDESWVRCHPYEQRAKAGGQVKLQVIVTNHSRGENPLACRAVLPRAWTKGGRNERPSIEWVKSNVPAKKDTRVPIAFCLPTTAQVGRYVIPIEFRYGAWTLPQFTETIVVL
jgi:glyoxylase-like metal-dependent hydrolase (beta-lactamase superfamily II)